MNVLIACEYSGIIRDAFIKEGHNALSCDLLETEQPGPHYQGNVLDLINEGWDLMIAHPPCTYLSYAGTAVWNQEGRAAKRLEALAFFLNLWEAKIPHICIENPLGIASKVIKKHDQVIHPYYWGDPHLKRTCLWLKNLPLLKYQLQDNLFSKASACEYPKPIYVDKKGRKLHFTESLSGGKNRSKSFEGMARAMAQQWGNIITKHLAS